MKGGGDMVYRCAVLTLVLWWGGACLWAQDPSPAFPSEVARSSYQLGPEDQISIHVTDMDEIPDKPLRISADGYISLPHLGRFRVSGMTVQQLETELASRLRAYVKVPEVNVSLTEMRSQPVTVIGEVNSPGVRQLEGRKTLLEMLSLAGGLKEDAGYEVQITRKLDWGRIPLADAKDDSTGRFSVAKLKLADVTQAQNPEDNIQIMPEDVINVPKVQMVYVIGDVNKQGSIMLGSQQTVSMLQVISIAAGWGKTAKPSKAKILRPDPQSPTQGRIELPVDLKAILANKAPDIQMRANDILYVPTSGVKAVAQRSLDVALGPGVASILYRIP